MKFFQLGGSILLIVGLLVIGYALWSSYQIFTGQKEVYALFPTNGENSPSKVESSSAITEQMQTMMGEQLAGVIPQGSISKLLNLVSWSVLAWIFIIGGGKVSSLGIRLLKNPRKAEKS